MTLTYSDDNLPKDGSLVPEDFTLFMKRLRKQFGEGIRYFACGEYGEQLGRPHYHACLFNFDFPDKELHTISNEHRIYKSETLNRMWGLGHCWIGSVTFESAAYVARYVMKKVTGDRAEGHYEGKVPEYVRMSRRPGIGTGWYEKFKSDCYPSDFLIYKGKKAKVPRFYDKKLMDEDLAAYDRMKLKRVDEAVKRGIDDLYRLRTREKCKEIALAQLKRPLESGS